MTMAARRRQNSAEHSDQTRLWFVEITPQDSRFKTQGLDHMLAQKDVRLVAIPLQYSGRNYTAAVFLMLARYIAASSVVALHRVLPDLLYRERVQPLRPKPKRLDLNLKPFNTPSP